MNADNTNAPALMERQLAASDRINVRPHSETSIVRLTVKAPDLPNQHGFGTCVPDSVDLTYNRYEDGRREMRATVHGFWRSPFNAADGRNIKTLTDKRLTCTYTSTPDEWPDWVAGLAYDYHPEPHTLPTTERSTP